MTHLTSANAGVSFVIPTFREYAFGDSLDYLLDYLRTHEGRRFEILVVDDSDDEGFAQLQAVVDERRRALGSLTTVEVIRGPRRGKGAAVRVGALAARQDFVFLVDADVPVPPRFIAVFLDRLAAGADIVIGERDAGRYAGKPLRHVLARGLLALQTVVVFHGRKFSDTQCGFKAFRADVLRALAKVQATDGGMYDLEYLYAATRRKLRVEHVAVELRGEVRESRINLVRCMVHDPLAIFYFKGRGILGRYER